MKINRERLWIMAWFTFTRHERNGLLVLSIILLLFQSVLLYRYFIRPDLQPHKLPENEARMVNRLISSDYPDSNLKKQKEKEAEISYPIDPNNISEAEWIAFGLSPKQAAVISKWKAKGGIFRTMNDVEEMKFIPQKVKVVLKPWLVFEYKSPSPQQNFRDERKPVKKMDLNTADTTLLCELPLIGPGRARTIWKFRERLGGYYSVEQLKEIKSIPDSVYSVISEKLEIITPVYRKIDINTVTDSLYHPYFSKSLLRMMAAYRQQNGLFITITDLQKLPLVDEDLWRKIAPYITLSIPSVKP